MTHVHMSLKHSADDAAVLNEVVDTLDEHRPRSLSTTESTGFRGELRGIHGYMTAHDRGREGQAESAILVRSDAFVRTLPAVLLSDKPIPRRGSHKHYAARADTTDGQILAVHMGSGVEGKYGFRRSITARRRVAAYRDAIDGLRRYVVNHPEVTEIWGDWNLDARLPWVKAYFARKFPDFVMVVPDSGTHGRRVIDWGLVRNGHGDWTAEAVVNPVSDHRTVIATRQESTVGHLPRNLPDLLRARGLNVVEVPGWHGRGRPGSFAPVGVLCHHTGSYDTIGDTSSDLAYAKWLATEGRSDLPAPLCQLALSREGVVYVCASGRANHGGTAKASGSVAAGDGNTLYVGIEAMNDGSQGWDWAQYDAYVTLAAAVCADVTGNSVRTVRAHKETSTTGKWDPGRMDMDEFRADVQAQIDDWATNPRRPNREDWLEMATEKEVRALVRDELKAFFRDGDSIGRGRVTDEKTGSTWTLAQLLWDIRNKVATTDGDES